MNVISALDEIDRLVGWASTRLGQDLSLVEDSDSTVGGLSHDTIVLADTATGERVFVRIAPEEGPFAPYDVQREGRLLERLEGVLPVPRVLGASDGRAAGTRPFVLLEWLDGEVKLPERGQRRGDAAARSQVADDLVATLAGIHAVDALALGLADVLGLPSVALAERLLARWQQVLDGLRVQVPPAAWYALWWLRQRVVREERQQLVHGDFRLGNLVWQAHAVAILDWEHATLGDPLYDLGWLCMGAPGDEDLVMGLVAKADLIARYESATGWEIDPERLAWWETAATWVRLCMESRALDFELTRIDSDLRGLVWETASNQTSVELLTRIEQQVT